MILGLRSAKRQISTESGASFFNDFSNALHSDINGEQIALALNAGTTDWTVSPANEAALLIPHGDSKALVIIDPQKKTRLFQTFQRLEITDLILTEKKFAVAASGLLISGDRAADGSIQIKGSRGLDRGLGFRLQLEDDGRLSYSKRGSCRRTFVNLETRARETVYDPQLLWNVLFNDIYEKGYVPKMPETDWIDYKKILLFLRHEASIHKLNDYGVRLYSLVAALERSELNAADELEKMIAIDNEIQCKSLINEPFPCHKMLQTVLGSSNVAALKPSSISQVHIMRSVRLFEDMAAQLKNTKLLSSNLFTDTHVES